MTTKAQKWAQERNFGLRRLKACKANLKDLKHKFSSAEYLVNANRSMSAIDEMIKIIRKDFRRYKG